VFAFDNSKSHGTFAKDALSANNMNLNPGGKNAVKLRDTVFNGQIQSMNFSDDHEDAMKQGQPKGIKQVLLERNLWRTDLKLNCKDGCPNDEEEGFHNCCARTIMSQQPDFLAQKSMVEEMIEARGHKVIFYPKFHCELNYIEMYWGAAKRYTREHCDYTWAGLLRTVPDALDQVPITLIRKFARKSARYMDVYRKGLTGKAAEYATRKYHSHRRVPESIFSDMEQAGLV